MGTILAVDTSCDACSVALLHDGVVHSRTVSAPRQHSQRLLPMIDELLVSQNLEISNVDAIAYGRGPGSFTGLRICLGIVQGLAFAADIPVIAVSTLQTLAVGAIKKFDLTPGDRVLVALDARMQEVYWGVYESQQIGVVAITDEVVSSPDDVLLNPELVGTHVEHLVKVGPGCHYPALVSVRASHEDLELLPRAEHMLDVALQALRAGQTQRAEETQPVYLRDSVAWQKRKRIRQ